VCRSESVSLRDLLNQEPRVLSAAEAEKEKEQQQQQISSSLTGPSSLGNNSSKRHKDDSLLKALIQNDQPPRLMPVLPLDIQQALRTEVLAVLRGS